MKILVLGSYGMLGHKIFQVLSRNFDVYGTCREPSHQFIDLIPAEKIFTNVDANNIEQLDDVINKIRPNYVINCIGIIKHRDESKDPIPSIKINALFPHLLANLCKKYHARVIHFSTDCVFSGEKGHYKHEDKSDAEDLYGRTKFLGELHYDHCLTLRSSIIGRELYNMTGLLEWFLSMRGKTVRGYKNVFFSGISTIGMAKIIVDILMNFPSMSGLWQVATHRISKYELLSKISDRMRLGIDIIPEEEPICDRSLDGSLFNQYINFSPPSWDDMITELEEDAKQYT
ncbi:MAG: SDR family oxidoreductase [Candidatus Magasanikbacteria bacterium]|nr:SDR family oxidoreductase [Candidatus Magasanikbacteria bacterium]